MTDPMLATMMHRPLTIEALMRHGERAHAASRISTFDGEKLAWHSFADVATGARRLASALQSLGVRANDRVATLRWNDIAHFEAYLAVPSLGAVLHTLNLRLFDDQIGYIMRHASDRVLITDRALCEQFAAAIAQVPSLEHVIVTDGPVEIDGFSGQVHDYAQLVARHDPVAEWPEVDEKSAAVACYTSGTTGNPKGVVYSHRTIFLHSLASMATNAFAVGERDTILLLPPMFHANAWGLPFTGWFSGARFVLPGSHLSADAIRSMIALSSPTITATVPTILNELLRKDRENPVDMHSFRCIIAGGSAVSEKLIADVRERWGVPVVQGWGMTETSPLCVLSHPPEDVTEQGERDFYRAKSGRPVPGVEARIVDDDGNRLAEDGETVGRLQLRGPWIASGYHAGEGGNALTSDGWLDTGDAGTIDTRGYVQVTDRFKDLIKSGGEWIPSVDLENRIAALPGVAGAAVVGVPDPKWEERPLAIVVPEAGQALDFRDLRKGLTGQIAKFWVPDYWATVGNLPTTSVGKIDKVSLRADALSGKLAFERIANGS